MKSVSLRRIHLSFVFSAVFTTFLACAGGAKEPAADLLQAETSPKLNSKTDTKAESSSKANANSSSQASSSSKPKPHSSTNSKVSTSPSSNSQKESPGDPAINNIKKIVNHYQKVPGLEMAVKKEVYTEYMDETKFSEGKLYFSKRRLRLEMDKPDKYLLLMNKNTIWMENHLPKEMGGVQVSRVQSSNKIKESNALMAFMFDNVKVWDGFDVVKSKAIGEEEHIIELAPKKNQNLGDVVKMSLHIHTNNKWLSQITYWDSLDNKTSYIFSKIEIKNKIQDKLFEYKPPKGVAVTNL